MRYVVFLPNKSWLTTVHYSCISCSIISLLTSVPSVSDFETTMSASSQNLPTFTRTVVLHTLNLPWHEAQIVLNILQVTDSPSDLVSESKGANNFTGVGKYPPLHQAKCLFK